MVEKSSPLGEPLPSSNHAISVSLPTWDDVIGYEEGDKRVINSLKSGYPRFVIHPTVQKLFSKFAQIYCSENQKVFLFPSLKAAIEANEFIASKGRRLSMDSNTGVEIEDKPPWPLKNKRIHALVFDAELYPQVKAFWQHSGQVISSRQAEWELSENTKGQQLQDKELQYHAKVGNLQYNIARLTGVSPNDVYLFESGMAAIFRAHKMVLSLAAPKSRTVQFGFPYLDTLKLQEKFSAGVEFFGIGEEEDLETLRALCKNEKFAGIFTEFPTNPLLKSVDIAQLSQIARQNNFPLIVDDTVGSFYNVNLFPEADILVTSLSKFYSGSGEVMAGSLVLNPQSPFYERFKKYLQEEYLWKKLSDFEYQFNFWPDDLIKLEEGACQIVESPNGNQVTSYEARMQKINSNAERLCDFLKAHPTVKEVYYPKFINTKNYLARKRQDGGYGGLFSFVLLDESRTPSFYDAVQLPKGPSLGNSFTMLCPYTQLAHYNELDWAEKYGVSSYLIRVSVGCEENFEEVIELFAEALNVI
jgi:cystathionine gamma-synthase